MRRGRRGGIAAAGMGTRMMYSGVHDVREIDVGGTTRTLWTLRGSGTLTVIGDVVADVWLCGSGAAGGAGIPGVKAGDGGGGASAVSANGVKLRTGSAQVSWSPTIRTVFMDLTALCGNAKNGGTGAGAGAMLGGIAQGGVGDKAANKIPFGLSQHFQPHCAGGGGGGFAGGAAHNGCGGAGGTQGAAGSASTTGDTKSTGGAGGASGGGTGGAGQAGALAVANHGGHASTYGSGGGGGGGGLDAKAASNGGNGGGGVVYLLV